MEAAVRQSAKPAVVRHCSARYKTFLSQRQENDNAKRLNLDCYVLVGSPNIDSTINFI